MGSVMGDELLEEAKERREGSRRLVVRWMDGIQKCVAWTGYLSKLIEMQTSGYLGSHFT